MTGSQKNVPRPIQRSHTLLAHWWESGARDLPWRNRSTTPWAILVCEVMSQQTQMSRVVPYWKKWMELWPDAATLADATPAEVITAWGRLGYPRRALRLKACAQQVRDRFNNQLPQTYEELISLPGIGDYTANAVLSFAYGQRVAVIDTNIRRVLTRVFTGVESHGGATKPQDKVLAEEVLPGQAQEAVVWNQATMELGALVCTAKNPDCSQCPLNGVCAFLKAGCPGLGEGRTRPRQHFRGTDRQVRGVILAALRELPVGSSLPMNEVDNLWPDASQLGSCLASLDDDGLIEIVGGDSIRLPG
ncbi:A/G-specific adenine glycosylase [Bombiscardovia coagulans]|uniref:Adenine DNA glycosylase n=1 Tax=Bombiscardovia coagulans TaxID=686666 RepID=A0A261EUS7_9BIFI|nr:A/G-specific adenine glycosylase [Bombiscardovia coagulans]OZG50618.1 adenine glycosylase [Bombiscardovia coagulans]